MKQGAIRRVALWAGSLIFVGLILALALIVRPSIWTWVAVFAGGGLGALIAYLTDRTDPGLLIAPYLLWIVAGLGVLLKLEVLEGALVATYLLAALAVPAVVAGLHRRIYRWLWVIAVALVVLAALIPLVDAGILIKQVIITYMVSAFALPFLILWATGRVGSWALWLTYALVMTGLLFPLTEGDAMPDALIAPYVLTAAGVPMWLRALLRREWDWRVYGGYALLVSAGLVVLVEDGALAADYLAPAFFLATALGFVVGHLRRRHESWPLLLAGVATVAGVALAVRQDTVTYLGATVLVIVGLAVIVRELTRPVTTGRGNGGSARV